MADKSASVPKPIVYGVLVILFLSLLGFVGFEYGWGNVPEFLFFSALLFLLCLFFL